MGHVITTESLSGQQGGSLFHRHSYEILQPEAFQIPNATDQDHGEFLMAGPSSQPVSPITLTHLPSVIDGHFMEDNVHAI